MAVARFRLLARAYGLTDVSLQGRHVRFGPLPLPDSKQLRLKRYHPDAVYKAVTEQVSVPRPATRRIGGEPLRDQALLDWCAQLLTDVLGAPAAVAAARRRLPVPVRERVSLHAACSSPDIDRRRRRRWAC